MFFVFVCSVSSPPSSFIMCHCCVFWFFGLLVELCLFAVVVACLVLGLLRIVVVLLSSVFLDLSLLMLCFVAVFFGLLILSMKFLL